MKQARKLVLWMSIAIVIAAMTGCSNSDENNSAGISNTKENGKINVVATIFPEYDFLRAIGGEHINLSMLLTPGSEAHSFEPTPQDIKTVNEADMFVYVGGDSDAWVESILDSVDIEQKEVVTLMDCVTLVEEEVVEGMTAEEEHGEETHEDEEEPEYDEHVWTSPKNTMLIVQKLCDSLSKIDPEHADSYQANTDAYIEKLEALDQEFREMVSTAKRTEIIVGDRFPFRYLAEEYGLTYYAAFPGCAGESEASAATIAFLTDKVKTDEIPVVFHIELSNENVCNSICEATGAKSELLNAVHNVTKDDFENGTTYLDMMERNVEVLREALN